jgi:GNAT superfamily N-acetyltransferase
MTRSVPMSVDLRPARLDDVAAIGSLMAVSARTLLRPFYSLQQIDAALGSVFAVDRELLADGTYFVVTDEATITGCGGWSRRKTLFGASRPDATSADSALDPSRDPARIRAFFVHPSHARRGIGAALMRQSQQAAADAGFTRMELVATLGGEPLYAAFGFEAVERFDIPLAGALTMAVVRMRKNIALS